MNRARSALPDALVTAATVSLLVYPSLRVAERLAGNEVDSAKILLSEHSGFAWRAVTSLFVGIASAIVLSMVPPAFTDAATRAMPKLLVLAVVWVVVQVAFFP